jgi:predicted Zn-dependent protease
MYVKGKTFAAFVLRQSSDLEGALDAVDEALAVQPDNQNLTLYSVLVLRDLRKYREAETRLRKALQASPGDELIQFNLALVLHERGKEKEALAIMERIAEANPKNSDALNYVAYAQAELGADLDRALRMANQAIELRPNDGFYLDTQGFILFKQGKLPLAEEVLARATSITGQDPVIVEHYVQVLLARQKYAEAVGVLKLVCEQDLSASGDRDKDKHDALDRMKRTLKEILKERPDLQSVQKSQNSAKSVQGRLRRPTGPDLVRDINDAS